MALCLGFSFRGNIREKAVCDAPECFIMLALSDLVSVRLNPICLLHPVLSIVSISSIELKPQGSFTRDASLYAGSSLSPLFFRMKLLGRPNDRDN